MLAVLMTVRNLGFTGMSEAPPKRMPRYHRILWCVCASPAGNTYQKFSALGMHDLPMSDAGLIQHHAVQTGTPMTTGSSGKMSWWKLLWQLLSPKTASWLASFPYACETYPSWNPLWKGQPQRQSWLARYRMSVQALWGG